MFDQVKKNEVGEETKRTSVINLVDLAGELELFFEIPILPRILTSRDPADKNFRKTAIFLVFTNKN